MADSDELQLLELPDVVIGLGEAGRELVGGALEQDWFIDAMLQERSANQDYDFFLVDSSTDDGNERQRVDEILSNARERRDELGGNDPSVPNLSFTEINLVEENSYHGYNDLIAKESVGDILSAAGTDHWWLESSDHYIDDNADFGSGVVRRRALSKALYYGDKESTSHVDRIRGSIDEEVAIAVGIGGGTGSGTFIDLARDLNERGGLNITLFAVLPAVQEPEIRCTNAMAALSELEFLSLTNDNPFHNIVVLPYQPVYDNGQEKARYQRELDEAFATTLSAYYSLDSDFRKRTAGQTPSFAPFTVAATQVLHYNTESVEEAKSAIREFIETQSEAHSTEEDIYQDLVEMMADMSEQIDEIENGSGTVPEEYETLRPQERNRLQRRLDEFHDLLSLRAFEELGIQSAGEVENLYDSAHREEDDPVEEVLERLDNNRRAASLHDQLTEPDEVDEDLLNVLEKEIVVLNHRLKTIRYKAMLDDEDIGKNVVDAVIGNLDEADQSIYSPATVLGQADDVQSDLSDARERLEQRREEYEELETELDSLLDGWLQSAGEELDALTTIQTQRESFLERAGELDGELDDIAALGVNNAESEAGVDTELDFDYAGFHRELSAIGVELDPSHGELQDVLNKLAECREKTFQQEEGMLSSLKGKVIGRDPNEVLAEEYDRARATVRGTDPGLFRVPTWEDQTFQARYQHDFRSAVDEALDERAAALRESVVGQLEAALDDADFDRPGSLDPVAGELQSPPASAAALREALSGTARELVAEEALATLRQRVAETEAEVGELEEKKARLDRAELTLGNDWDENTIARAREEVAERRSVLEEADFETEADPDYRFVKRTNPEDIYDALDMADLEEMGAWDPTSPERDVIENSLHEFAGNLEKKKSEYLGVNELTVTAEPEGGRARYNGHRVGAVYMSRAFDEETFDDVFDDDPFREQFLGNSIKLERSSDYEKEVIENGHPWEVGSAMFLFGAFIDNLRNVTKRNDGYLAQHQKWAANEGRHVVARHSHGLAGEDDSEFAEGTDHGLYVRRESVRNLSKDAESDLFVNYDDSDEVGETLLGEHLLATPYVADHEYNERDPEWPL